MFVETEKGELPVSRRTQRIFARVLLCVSGKNQDGMTFAEDTFTIAVNADGGLLQLRKAVRKGQRLNLLQTKSGQQEFCIVAHVEPIEGGFTSVRVQFLEPHPEFWHVAFPPEDWTTRHPDSKFNKRPPLRQAVAASSVLLSNCQ
jgi:hypothetical protein